jgi:hypothetical protein
MFKPGSGWARSSANCLIDVVQLAFMLLILIWFVWLVNGL